METLNNINYKVLAEVKLTGEMANSQYVSMVMLRRPNGHIKHQGLRTKDGKIELV